MQVGQGGFGLGLGAAGAAVAVAVVVGEVGGGRVAGNVTRAEVDAGVVSILWEHWLWLIAVAAIDGHGGAFVAVVSDRGVKLELGQNRCLSVDQLTQPRHDCQCAPQQPW